MKPITERTTALSALDRSIMIHPHAVLNEAAPPLIFERGTGALLWDTDGNEYIDGTCGLWQCPVGHGRRELAQIASDQIEKLEFYSSFNDFSNEPSIRLGERLVELAPDGISHVFLTNGGSEGNETAIKLARLARFVSGEPERNIILARTGGYHGMGGNSLAVTGLDNLHAGFGPMIPGVEFLTKPHEADIGPDATTQLVKELEDKIEDVGGERIAAFIGEPALGVGGMVPPPEGYWPAVEQVLRKHGILLIVDEIVTAFGRTGHWFASERYGITPDLIVTAKGITSGYIPMGAVLVNDRVMEMASGHQFLHGFTYNGHPVGAAVALENINILEREGLLERALMVGERLFDALKPLEKLNSVREVRGVGMMLSIELTEDSAPVMAQARADGVIVRGAGKNIIISPPLVITDEQVDRFIEIVTRHVAALG